MRSLVVLAIALAVLSAACSESWSESDFISEGVLSESNPRQVSICLWTESFNDEEDHRLRAALGKATDRFEELGLDFYISYVTNRRFTHEPNHDLVGDKEARAAIEDNMGTLCDIMFYATRSRATKPGLAQDPGAETGMGWSINDGQYHGVILYKFNEFGFSDLTKIIQHELGHVFCAKHTSTSGSVMRGHIDDAGTSWDKTNSERITQSRDQFANRHPDYEEYSSRPCRVGG